jgi:RNA-directed DNA polymerase
LIGAFFLDELDRCLGETGLFCVRFVDDILVLAPTRCIGRIERGFDFRGHHFTADSLTLAVGTLANFIDRASRLYEQERQRPKDPSLRGAYVRRWWAWANGA